MKPLLRRSLSPVILLSLFAACGKSEEKRTPTPAATAVVQAKPAEVEIEESLLTPFAPLPATMDSRTNSLTEDKITLGRILYYEKRVSMGKDISCNTCHDLATNGAQTTKTSEGHKKQAGKRNSPTVFNAAGHFAQFWDGRAATVEEQAKGPITNPIEMGMPNEKAVLAEINKVAEYKELFKKAFPADKDPITINNLSMAIGAFERKLVTPSRWDKYLKGDKTALTSAEKEGFNKFSSVGCVTCHSGEYLGGKNFQKLGSVKPWPNETDLGRQEVTKQEVDKQMFKVPSLRNIERTAPYFHDGSIASLDEAVKLMGKHQLGKDLSEADTTSIVTFLKALTGEVDKAYIAEPPTLGVKPGAAKPAAPATK